MTYAFHILHNAGHGLQIEVFRLYGDLNASTALFTQQAIEYDMGKPCWIERV